MSEYTKKDLLQDVKKIADSIGAKAVIIDSEKMNDQKVLEPGYQIVSDAMQSARDEIKQRAIATLYTHYKEIQDKRKHCSMQGRNFNTDIEGMNMALAFRQTLSFCRLIFQDRDFFKDQMETEV